jgi:ABC-type polysaccharide/polyol phosphate export permease
VFYDSDVKSFPVLSLLGKIFENFSLLKILVAKELAIRYKKSFIGIWWSLLNPLFTTAVLFYVFNTAFKNKIAQSDHFIPYILCGVLVITFFNQSLAMVSDSILGNANIFTKMYVRPEMFGIAAAIAGAINFVFGLIPLFLVAAWSDVAVTWSAVAVLYVLVCLLFIAIGLGLLCSIAYIFFEDFRSIIQLLVMVIGYMTPVFYPIAVLGPHTRPVIEANPLTSVLAVFRSSFGKLEVSHLSNWIYSGAFSISIFLLGVYVFEKLWPKAVVRL